MTCDVTIQVAAPSAAVPLERAERQHCFDLMLEAADALTASSMFAADAPSLHARFLRRLVASSQTLWDKEQGIEPVQDDAVQVNMPTGFDVHMANNMQAPTMANQNMYLPQVYPVPLDTMAMAPPISTSGMVGDDSLLMQLWWDFMSTSGNNNNGNGMPAY
jgi:hypothetical protein